MKILFQGDSITDANRDRLLPRYLGQGYVSEIACRFERDGLQHEIRNTAIGGNRICDIYGRWIEDTLNIDFDMLSILCGINDIGFQIRENKGVDPIKWRFIYDRMLYEVKEKNADAKLVLMEPFVFKINLEDVDIYHRNDIYRNYDLWSGNIMERAEIMRDLAKEYEAIVVPLIEVFDRYSNEMGVEKLTSDGIHPTLAGHKIIADQWIKACRHVL